MPEPRPPLSLREVFTEFCTHLDELSYAHTLSTAVGQLAGSDPRAEEYAVTSINRLPPDRLEGYYQVALRLAELIAEAMDERDTMSINIDETPPTKRFDITDPEAW